MSSLLLGISYCFLSYCETISLKFKTISSDNIKTKRLGNQNLVWRFSYESDSMLEEQHIFVVNLFVDRFSNCGWGLIYSMSS